jgi:putative ABC transport system permease protein
MKPFFQGNPFDYFFLDDFFNQKYQADQQFGKVFGLFAALAILVACLGLFGLASFTITQRTKEIGIRKVLGASESNILFLLSKDFATLILLSNLIAWPMAYWGINQWLQNYPYRIGLSPWLFIIPALIVLAIALLTISVQTIRTARSNPLSPCATNKLIVKKLKLIISDLIKIKLHLILFLPIKILSI